MVGNHLPLAWYNLVHNRRRLVGSLAGVTLAIVLMFMQIGIWAAFIDSSVALADQFNGELILITRGRYGLAAAGRFPIHRLEQARGVPGVKAAYPIYLEAHAAFWKDPSREHLPVSDEPASRPIRVIGIDPTTPALKSAEVWAQQGLLKRPQTVLMDRKSKAVYGEREAGLRRELSRHAVEVVGTFALGTDFTTDGNLIVADRTFAELFPNPLAPPATLKWVDVGVIQLAPGSQAREVQKTLQRQLPEDVWVFTHPEFVRQEEVFWMTSTPIGFIFLFGLVMGIVVGMVICWQILSADVTDRLKEYATLKAVGYTNGYLILVVLQQGFWLSLLSYVPALVFSFGLYTFLSWSTGLPLGLTPGRLLTVFALTVGMCVVSGVLSLRKVYKTDPAEVF